MSSGPAGEETSRDILGRALSLIHQDEVPMSTDHSLFPRASLQSTSKYRHD